MLTEIPASKEWLEKICLVSVEYNRLCWNNLWVFVLISLSMFPGTLQHHTYCLWHTHTHSFYFVPYLLINLLLTEQMPTCTFFAGSFILSISAHFLLIINVYLHQLIRRHALSEHFFSDGFIPLDWWGTTMNTTLNIDDFPAVRSCFCCGSIVRVLYWACWEIWVQNVSPECMNA